MNDQPNQQEYPADFVAWDDWLHPDPEEGDGVTQHVAIPSHFPGFSMSTPLDDGSPEASMFTSLEDANVLGESQRLEQLALDRPQTSHDLDIERPACTKNNLESHEQLICSGCGEKFKDVSNLKSHWSKSCVDGYKSFVCTYPDCTRPVYAENSHWKTWHNASTSRTLLDIPALIAESNKGFKRKDHLRQHIRDYHHIDEAITATEQEQVPTVFNCPREGCDRIDMNGFESINGWLRGTDMIKHTKKAHPKV
ncbi:hypothetical protein M7I_3146 [Glarea lozoyensis 74030]|uniref:C2H2-type domain-containing protein n=1 Tax=Glarea lozoyensis (strain ATCC 74030 / MF5533) TaxID=1104152 RepID=H0EKR7_GLAL7|nr:hypothetical protein M7I_3146 [Glarea lozoyensis 74030]